MPQKNKSMKQKWTQQTPRTDLWLPREKDGLGVWDSRMHTIIQRMDKQQGPTIHTAQELYSVSEWKGI